MLNSVQVIRAAAAIAVVLFHLGGAVAAPKYFDVPLAATVAGFGTNGVLLFFVLSGFIIHHVHARDLGRPERLKAYLIRRILRVYPVYWLVLSLVVGFALVTGVGIEGMPTDPSVIVRTLLLWPQDKAVVGGTGAPILIVDWSLQYEMLFYLGFALCIANLRLGLVLIALFMVGLLWLSGTGQHAVFPGFMEPKHFLFFAMGVLASRASRLPIPEKLVWSGALIALGLVAAAWIAEAGFAVYSHGGFRLFASMPGAIALGLLSVLLIGSFAILDRYHPTKPSPMLLYLGACSYLIYLVHFPVISAACKVALAFGLTGNLGAGVAALLSLLGTIALAALLHEVFEKPLLAFARSRTRPASAGRAA